MGKLLLHIGENLLLFLDSWTSSVCTFATCSDRNRLHNILTVVKHLNLSVQLSISSLLPGYAICNASGLFESEHLNFNVWGEGGCLPKNLKEDFR